MAEISQGNKTYEFGPDMGAINEFEYVSLLLELDAVSTLCYYTHVVPRDEELNNHRRLFDTMVEVHEPRYQI